MWSASTARAARRGEANVMDTAPPQSRDGTRRTCLAIVLAAGESSRMRSARPKVLHELASRSMLSHVLSSLVEVGAERTVVVAGPNHDAIMAEAN
jgi:bifunctional UDP-N-acetylglucosamine pyrophosphorylase / glucosamine-1-phosphate N-acetyltransferase